MHTVQPVDGLDLETEGLHRSAEGHVLPGVVLRVALEEPQALLKVPSHEGVGRRCWSIVGLQREHRLRRFARVDALRSGGSEKRTCASLCQTYV